MHDIKTIRENPDAFDAGLKRRGLEAISKHIIRQHVQLRLFQSRDQEKLALRNDLSKQIGAAKARKQEIEADRLMAEVTKLKEDLPKHEAETAATAFAIEAELVALPNLPAADVPDGKDETHNHEEHRWPVNDKAIDPPHTAWAKEHFDIGAPLGLDFESAQSVSGARFVYLRKGIARLSRALGQFMLDTHTEQFGYEEVNPPVLVRDEALFGTGQLPKFAEDLFKTNEEKPRFLIPTAEVPLTNLVRDQIIAEPVTPLRFTALTQCFRSEAGAAGKDTRGLIRQHQFEKVELVSICRPEDSDDEHERMTSHAEHILEALELPYRRMLLCTGDMGFSARKTYDLEVWLPGQGRYREISSISNCGDFQARRMNTRYKTAGEKGTTFVHTLNGSGLAVGRALVAVLENYQQADGSVTIPKVLLPYMGTLTELRA